ncbi:hypothetical protein DSO57_1003143 [Entomophthora muscae]|uniref:Uncharacterized protein n=1 Tax=Entomophthora muscae TaxID=34485 RepID=A0ACC2RNE9_9FUNG|nr:hypothetical protein DSO57_1003143 [Entomophthora muscae]
MPTYPRLTMAKRVGPKPKWWLPTDVTELLDMKAIQHKMKEQRAKDWRRVDALLNKEGTKDHKNPSTPILAHIDKEPFPTDQTIHPDSEEWQKANTKQTPQKK